MENKRLIKKSALYFIGNFSSKVLTALLVPVYAFCIPTDALGTYDYSQTIMNIIIPIIFVSIWEAIIRFVLGEDNKNNKEKEYANTALFTLVVCLAFIIVMIIVGQFVNVSYIHYFIPMVCFGALAQIWQYYARASERNKLYVITSVISTLTNLLLNIVLILILKLDIEALYISYICSQAIIFFILEYKMKVLKSINVKNLDWILLKKMLAYSAPLVVNSIASWLLNGFGKIIIFENLGASSNGLYTFANKFVTIITVVGDVVAMAILEEAMISLRNKQFNDNYPKVLQQVFKIFLLLITIAVPVITIFYSFIKTTEYYDSLKLIPILFLYSILLNMSTNFGIIFKTVNKNKYQVITTIFGSITMLAISFVLLRKFGVYGVAIGQLLSSVMMLLSRYYISKRFVKYSIDWRPIILMIFAYLIIAFVSTHTSIVINFILLFVTLILMILTNKSLLLKILKNVKIIKDKS